MQCKSQLHIKLTGFLPRRDFWIPQSVLTYFWGKDYAWISLPYFWAWVLEERCTWHGLQPFWWWYGYFLASFLKAKLKKDHRNKLTDFNQLFETNCLQRGLLLAVVLNYLAVRGRCYLPGLASTLVLLQPPVLTSTDVFLRYTLHSCSWRLFNYF